MQGNNMAFQSQFMSMLHSQPFNTNDTFLKQLNSIVNTSESIDKLCLTCNKIAMDYLGQNNFDFCFKLLKNAEKILMNNELDIKIDSRRKLLSLTFNNLGCYYKKKEKPNVALYYLKNSLEIEIKDPKSERLNLAGTHLNLTAILTKLGKHQEAVEHAKQAIAILTVLIEEKEKSPNKTTAQEQAKKVQFDQTPTTININTNLNNVERLQSIQEVTRRAQLDSPTRHTLEETNLYLTEAIAYYNLGASYEHLNNMDDAIKSYSVAKDIANQHLGTNHPLTNTIGQNLEKAQQKQKTMSANHVMRDFLRKEKGVGNFFKADNMRLMHRRLNNQALQNTTLDIGGENIENPKDIYLPSAQISGFSKNKKKRSQNRYNSLKPSGMIRINKTTVNSPNSSFVELKVQEQKQDLNEATDLLENMNNQKFILAVSPMASSAQQQRATATSSISFNSTSNYPKIPKFRTRLSSIEIQQAATTTTKNVTINQYPEYTMIHKPSTASGNGSRVNRGSRCSNMLHISQRQLFEQTQQNHLSLRTHTSQHSRPKNSSNVNNLEYKKTEPQKDKFVSVKKLLSQENNNTKQPRQIIELSSLRNF